MTSYRSKKNEDFVNDLIRKELFGVDDDDDSDDAEDKRKRAALRAMTGGMF